MTTRTLPEILRPYGMMDVKRVASLFGVKPDTIRDWVREGRFPEPHRFNRRVHRWSIRQLTEFINTLEQPELAERQ